MQCLWWASSQRWAGDELQDRCSPKCSQSSLRYQCDCGWGWCSRQNNASKACRYEYLHEKLGVWTPIATNLAEQLQYYRKRFIGCKIAWKKSTNQLCLCYIMVVLNFTFQALFEDSELFSLSFTILHVHTTNRHCLGLHRSFVTKQLSIKLKKGKLACKVARGGV